MNQERRKTLKTAVKNLEAVSELISGAVLDEECAMENVPESLQETDKYASMEEAVDLMNSALDSIEEAVSYVNDAASV